MGRYLVIGIATQLAFKKKEAETVLESVEKAKKHVTENYAPLEVYDMTENEDYVSFKLKDKLLETDLKDFLKDFYSDRLSFGSQTNEGERILEALEDIHTAEGVLSMADEKSWPHFQSDPYWDSIYVEGKWRKEMQIYVKGIDLSVDGKILIECTNGLFEYFASLLREKYKNHSLSKTLHVTISE